MIRINLLPQKKRAQLKDGSQLWLGVVLGLMLLEIVVLFVFHGIQSEELSAQESKNRVIETQIEQSKTAVGKHADVANRLAELRAREEALGMLHSARSGPTAVLLELSRILTTGRGPTMDVDRLNQLKRDNPLAVFNQNWDARRLWLTSFKEDKRKVRIDGLARDGEDISELARRMGLSDYFTNVKLMPAKREIDPESKLELVRFSVEAEVKY